MIFYSQTLYSVSQFLKRYKDSLSISDCNSLTGSAICGRLIFAALVKSNDYGVLSADKAKNNWLLTSASVSISAFKEHLPNALSPPTKKDFARLGLDTRKFLNEKNLSDLMKITAVSDQKQFRTALRKSMNAEDMSFGEQAKLELLFQSISLEKLEQISKKLNDDFKVKFNKPKGVEANTLHINKKEIDALVTQQMLKCLQI